MAGVSTLHKGDVLFALSYSGAIIIAVTGLSENPKPLCLC